MQLIHLNVRSTCIIFVGIISLNVFRFYELDLKKSLRRNFQEKTIVEFPIIFVVLESHKELFSTEGKIVTSSVSWKNLHQFWDRLRWKFFLGGFPHPRPFTLGWGNPPKSPCTSLSRLSDADMATLSASSTSNVTEGVREHGVREAGEEVAVPWCGKVPTGKNVRSARFRRLGVM